MRISAAKDILRDAVVRGLAERMADDEGLRLDIATRHYQGAAIEALIDEAREHGLQEQDDMLQEAIETLEKI